MNEANTPLQPRQTGTTSERLLLGSAFLLTGVIAVLLGPLIPELEASWSIDHAQTGSLFLVQFSASSFGAIVSSLNLRRSIVAGYALSSVSLFGLALGGWPLARFFMAVSGFSLGLVISGTNLLVARKNPVNRGAALSALNLIWGIGAVASPLLFAVFARSIGAFGLIQALGLLAVVASGALAVSLRNPPDRIAASPQVSVAHGSAVPLFFVVAALLFFYVGVEISIGGWLVSLSDQVSSGRSVVSLIIGSGFWGAILVGRAFAAISLGRLTETTLYSASLFLATIGTVTLFLARSRGAVATGAILAGLGLAALYPLTVSILASVTSSKGARFAGLIMAFGGFGGALLPWLTGRLSESSDQMHGSLSRGFLVPIVGLVAIATLFAVYRASRERLDARPP